MKRTVSFFAGLSLLVLAIPAQAQDLTTDINWNQCKDIVAANAIAGCTTVITSGNESLLSLAVAFNLRGNAYLRDGQFERAAADYRQSSRFDDGRVDPVFGYGLALYAQGRYGQALDVFNVAIERNPRYAEAIYGRGLAKRAMGYREEANDDFANARNVSSSVTRTLVELGVKP